jgi:hypothetical protein
MIYKLLPLFVLVELTSAYVALNSQSNRYSQRVPSQSLLQAKNFLDVADNSDNTLFSGSKVTADIDRKLKVDSSSSSSSGSKCSISKKRGDDKRRSTALFCNPVGSTDNDIKTEIEKEAEIAAAVELQVLMSLG